VTDDLLDHLDRRIHSDLLRCLAEAEEKERNEQAERFLRGPVRLFRTEPQPAWEEFRWPCLRPMEGQR
jgi:hypothetical protein